MSGLAKTLDPTYAAAHSQRSNIHTGLRRNLHLRTFYFVMAAEAATQANRQLFSISKSQKSLVACLILNVGATSCHLQLAWVAAGVYAQYGCGHDEIEDASVGCWVSRPCGVNQHPALELVPANNPSTRYCLLPTPYLSHQQPHRRTPCGFTNSNSHLTPSNKGTGGVPVIERGVWHHSRIAAGGLLEPLCTLIKRERGWPQSHFEPARA